MPTFSWPEFRAGRLSRAVSVCPVFVAVTCRPYLASRLATVADSVFKEPVAGNRRDLQDDHTLIYIIVNSSISFVYNNLQVHFVNYRHKAYNKGYD